MQILYISVSVITSLLKLFQQWIYPVLDDLSFTYFLETFLICWYNSFYEFLYTGLKLLHSFCLSVSLFVTSLDSDGPSLATGEFLLVSGVNFETSGLVDLCLQELSLLIIHVFFSINKQLNCKLVSEDNYWQYFHPLLLANKQTIRYTNITGFPADNSFA